MLAVRHPDADQKEDSTPLSGDHGERNCCNHMNDLFWNQKQRTQCNPRQPEGIHDYARNSALLSIRKALKAAMKDLIFVLLVLKGAPVR